MVESETYCFKCKRKVVSKNLEKSKQNSRNKMWIYKGTCSECGSVVCKLLKE